MNKSIKILSLILVSFLISSIIPTQVQASTILAYLNELDSKGMRRVVVEFKGEVDTSLIEKYGGNVIRGFETINGVICEIPESSIQSLKEEPSVREVAPDVLLEMESRRRDSKEEERTTTLKEDYLNRIKSEYLTSISEVREEYLEALKEYRTKSRNIAPIYLKFLERYHKSRDPRIRRIYRYIVSRYVRILKAHYATYRKALTEYRNKINLAKETYTEAQGMWREKVSEMMPYSYTPLSYEGEVEVRWNNLEAGLNSKAAWDRYDVSGRGVSIAFLDMGVNYTLPDLKDNYLGGIDYVDDDDVPITRNPDESHGTEVVSLAVAKGVSKVVGVAYNAGFYAIRMADESRKAFVSDMISGIEWATEKGVDIISISYTVYDKPGWDYWGPKFEDVCNAAYEAGIVIVAGSGNEGYSYSGYPAAFENVISVGMHFEDQGIPIESNGGVDVVAPGVEVYVIDPLNDLYQVWGTSYATPHVSGLIALQIEYARKNNIDYNIGYHWEVMKHGAIDLGISELWQGKGKAYAAGYDQHFEIAKRLRGSVLAKVSSVTEASYAIPTTSLISQSGYGQSGYGQSGYDQSGYGVPTTQLIAYSTSPTYERISMFPISYRKPRLGSIDLMHFSWPISYIFQYPGSFLGEDYPSFYIGETLNQDIILLNNTFFLGNETIAIEDLDITTHQKYRDTGRRLPGGSRENFRNIEPLEIDSGEVLIIQDGYNIPMYTEEDDDEVVTEEGVCKTELELEFNLEENDRELDKTDPEASIWRLLSPRY